MTLKNVTNKTIYTQGKVYKFKQVLRLYKFMKYGNQVFNHGYFQIFSEYK